MNEAERRGVRLRSRCPTTVRRSATSAWAASSSIVDRDARDDERAQRVLRSARDILESA